ncbi:DEAD/DEAH box helicase [Azotobacter beijerinckii]|uniref:DEAD/DEAH box helicase n=1 Tax=Azotobacter beijerinckii TaxID=170623 RepID=UPI002952CB92|nr:DEAD/DEAH box helicase [Azotobacter beijerinckii]MDV7212797.1 Zn-binding domain-containing protein [Azotobacter beijerinckii]
MSVTSMMAEAAGVHETTKSLADSLRQYIEAQYHIRDEGLVRERNALLRVNATVAQIPYVEATAVYKGGAPYSALPIPAVASEVLTELAGMGVGLYPLPYEHQSQALVSFLGDEAADLVIATGTGSGKTESFLMPVIGKLVIEGKERPESAAMPGCRALLLYPMNALVNDQLARIRRMLGNQNASAIISKGRKVPLRFGSYTGRTPYPGPRSASRDERFIKPLFEEFYKKVAKVPAVQSELARIGRWPSKDLDAFYGEDTVRIKTNSSGKQVASNNWKGRLKTQSGDRELMTRDEIQTRCPDLLVTNYSMLEYMLMRPIERDIFDQTKNWLKNDPRNEFILVLDEAHMYRGAGGAEVALLIRRLCARLEIPRERMRCILTSASLGPDATAATDGERFARDLTGLPEGSSRRFRVIQGTPEPRPTEYTVNQNQIDALADFDLNTFQRAADDIGGAVNATAILAERLEWNAPHVTDRASFRNWLFESLSGFGPLEKLITLVSGKAVRLDELSEKLFPDSAREKSEKATDTLLALGSHAQRRSDSRVLLPTRLHLFHRGLPGLYACVDPNCTSRLAEHEGPTILGRLHTKPSTQCGCDSNSRIFELLTHRDCGAAFIRGYVSEEMEFVWHQPNGPLSESGTAPLVPIEIFVEGTAHPRSRHRDMWLHMSTGILTDVDPGEGAGYRKVRIPDKPATGGDLTFDNCPVCIRRVRSGKDDPSKIMDHVTKGEAPFTTLVRTQMAKQPASRATDSRHPNGGRKVLIFSDGRQKAARLARDIPRDIELDVFRQAIALACQRLRQNKQESQPTSKLYLAFLQILSEQDLPIFDGPDAIRIEEVRAVYERDYGSDYLLEALGDNPPSEFPARYRIALLKLLCSSYYSLPGTTVGFVEPTIRKLKSLIDGLKKAGVVISDDDVRALAVGWIDLLLQDFAFDSSIDRILRHKAAGYPQIAWGSKGQFDKELRAALTTRLGWASTTLETVEGIFRDQLADKVDSVWFLSPNSVRLVVDLSHVWTQCPDCTALMPFALSGDICLACGSQGTMSIDPSSSKYVQARKGFWRLPVWEALKPGARLSNLSVEEHTAQLSNRDRSKVHATTELYELRFQDVLVNEKDRPIDVLSCTTTMEVGVDIGSLVAVALRNVPPQRENYQQRAGRAGRRGSSVSTVVTYSQNGPHDSHYFLNPANIVAGPPRTPEVKVDNEKIARRHVHAYLIQTFFHEVMTESKVPTEKTSVLQKALGLTQDFFFGAKDTGLNLESFKSWVSLRVLTDGADLKASVVAWLPPSLDTRGVTLGDWLALTADRLLTKLHELSDEVPPLETLDEFGEKNSEDGAATDGNPVSGVEQSELLEFLFFHGLLPSYAFPTSLCSFLVEKPERVNHRWEIRTLQRPQQSIAKALSEYAPGRLIVIDRKTYRCGGVFADLPAEVVDRARPLFANAKLHVHCKACSFVKDPNKAGDNGGNCPVCGGELAEEMMILPEIFGPENAKELPETDRDQEITYATMAQFPQPVDPESFNYINCGPYASYTHAVDQTLVTVNRGKESSEQGGFLICADCGHASVYDRDSKVGAHDRPYYQQGPKGTPEKCNGEFRRVLLGHDFDTDLLLLRLKIAAPIVTNTVNAVVLQILEDSLHSIAEALRLAASRHRQLDLDPAEFGSGFRIEPVLQDNARMLDVFLYDTLSGGAGYAEVAARHMPEILDAALELLEGCNCESSCTECLNHFHNQHLQSRLDRHLGAMLLRYAVRGELPNCASPGAQVATLSQLRASLELDGYQCTAVKSHETPLLVARGGRQVAIGSYPGLIDTPEFVHPVAKASGVYNHLGLNEYLLRSNLPGAHLRVKALFE